MRRGGGGGGEGSRASALTGRGPLTAAPAQGPARGHGAVDAGRAGSERPLPPATATSTEPGGARAAPRVVPSPLLAGGWGLVVDFS